METYWVEYTDQHKEYKCLIKNVKPTAVYLESKKSWENQTKLIEISKSKKKSLF